MGLAAKLDERAEKHAHRREQQPRAALEHFNDAPTDEEGEQQKYKNGQGKFHRRKFSECIVSRKLFNQLRTIP